LGAGMSIDSSDVSVTNCRFIGNEVDYVGAGGFILAPRPDLPTPSAVTLEDCIFLRNSARGGPAIAASDCDLLIRSCTIARNTVIPSALTLGVVDLEVSIAPRQMTIEQCILAFNNGNGLACHGEASPNFACNDLFMNTANEICGSDGGKNFCGSDILRSKQRKPIHRLQFALRRGQLSRFVWSHRRISRRLS